MSMRTSNNSNDDERLAPVAYLPWAGSENDADADAVAHFAALSRDDAPSDPARDALAAENILTRRLRSRSLSVSEARSVLAEADLDLGASEELIERFTRIGYLDDVRLA